MVKTTFREQYVDALSCYLREQEIAGLDIVTTAIAVSTMTSAARAGRAIHHVVGGL